MAKNHYTAGTTQLSKDTLIVDGLVVRRTHPRRDGVVGGVTTAYVDNVTGKVLGYTIADVRLVAAARKDKAKKADDDLDEGPNIIEIKAMVADAQRKLRKCPCCGMTAEIKTYDYMTYTIQCHGIDCRLKVERSVVNERGPKECIDIIVAAWNRRFALEPLLECAASAKDWLCDASKGTDQWERGQALAKAIKPFTK